MLLNIKKLIGDLKASLVRVESTNLSSTDVQGALDELFQYANNIKTKVAEVIGSPVTATMTSDEIKQSIEDIKVNLTAKLVDGGLMADSTEDLAILVDKVAIKGGGGLSQSVKLDIVAPYTKTITLATPVPTKDLCTTLLEHVWGAQGVESYRIDFDNADKENFIANQDLIFDGTMKIKDTFTYTTTETYSNAEGTDVVTETVDIDLSEYVFYGDIAYNVADDTVVLSGAKVTGAIATPTASSSLTNVYKVQGINWITATEGEGITLLAISFDGGATFVGYNSNTATWEAIDISNFTDFKSKGMSKQTVDGLTETELEDIRGGNTDFMGAYLIERPNYKSVAMNDSLSISVQLVGEDVIADTNKYTLSYDALTGVITYNINTSGTYIFNYVE